MKHSFQNCIFVFDQSSKFLNPNSHSFKYNILMSLQIIENSTTITTTNFISISEFNFFQIELIKKIDLFTFVALFQVSKRLNFLLSPHISNIIRYYLKMDGFQDMISRFITFGRLDLIEVHIVPHFRSQLVGIALKAKLLFRAIELNNFSLFKHCVNLIIDFQAENYAKWRRMFYCCAEYGRLEFLKWLIFNLPASASIDTFRSQDFLGNLVRVAAANKQGHIINAIVDLEPWIGRAQPFWFLSNKWGWNNDFHLNATISSGAEFLTPMFISLCDPLVSTPHEALIFLEIDSFYNHLDKRFLRSIGWLRIVHPTLIKLAEQSALKQNWKKIAQYFKPNLELWVRSRQLLWAVYVKDAKMFRALNVTCQELFRDLKIDGTWNPHERKCVEPENFSSDFWNWNHFRAFPFVVSQV